MVIASLPKGEMQVDTYTILGLAEEQIVDIFSSAGKVISFRLMYDNETGRPKGFGFAEYPDAGSQPYIFYAFQGTQLTSSARTDSAASAVRNLNGYEIMNRILKVDFSDSKHDGANLDKNVRSRLVLPQSVFLLTAEAVSFSKLQPPSGTFQRRPHSSSLRRTKQLLPPSSSARS
jgi:RNA recognition motif-containing protein